MEMVTWSLMSPDPILNSDVLTFFSSEFMLITWLFSCSKLVNETD